jgi:hypothetical protein
VLQFLPIDLKKKAAVATAKEPRMNLRFAKFAASIVASPFFAILFAAFPVSAQTVDLFPKKHDDPQHEVWTRVAIPPDHPVSKVAQWHIDYKKREIVCDGNGGHEWLRFNRELTNFTFHVRWRFTPVKTPTPKYNSGVFFRNNLDGSIWHQAQTSQEGGYIFGLTPLNGTPTPFNLQKDMEANLVKPAGEWNDYDIRCAGALCTLTVNGDLVNTAEIGLDKGYIGLESEGYRIIFKDLKVLELP